ncbi:hypothetical protein OO184_04120 [Photorhabdus sp. APURE]|uniref:hypothetical protein n=1 Tax=Photorhabdus aballayi TaxID=2991723 RepID=UPI00223DD478|nr:hypothetical protein [Photorhabdus aballayi]MCW7547151.1 hypothetical protein [Photorhabdus aballayi]
MKLVETVNEFFAIYAKLDPTTKEIVEFQLVNRKNNNTVVTGLSSIEEARKTAKMLTEQLEEDIPLENQKEEIVNDDISDEKKENTNHNLSPENSSTDNTDSDIEKNDKSYSPPRRSRYGK